MKVLVFGATGSIGTQLIQRGLAEGHEITAFTRKLAKVPLVHERLQKVEGDVLEASSVNEVLPGHDAVVVVLGAGIKGKIRSEGTRNVIAAMKKNKVKRLICQSTLGAGDSRENLNFYWKYIMFGGLLKKAYMDHLQQEKYVRESDLDWTIVRPGAFTDGPCTGTYRHGFLPADKTTQLKISRADVADFLLKQLSDLRYLNQSPGLSY